MTELPLIVVVAIAVAIWWKIKRDREPAILNELVTSLRNLADARNGTLAKKYHDIADAITEAQGYAASGAKPSPEESKRLGLAFVDAKDEGLLFTLGFTNASGRQAQAKEAIFALWKKVTS